MCCTALQRACDNKDAKAIRREVDRIREAGLTKYLQNETREAMYLVELLERMPANKNVLDMGRKLMTEVRRYQNPPPAMHRIMQSALLLLGEDEDTTDVRWNVYSRTFWFTLSQGCSVFEMASASRPKITASALASLHPALASAS